jgi:hypothetical protein
MNKDQDSSRSAGDPSLPDQQQQQQPQPDPEAHAGQGAESALKEMRAWEQRRAANSGGKRRQGPV